MAQLPPKVPTMSHNWPFQNMPPLPNSTTITVDHHNSWVDDFLDFSSARRNSHRRSVSDPIAFVEAPFLQQCRVSGSNNGFDKLDDEQLTTMFSDDSYCGGGAFAVNAPSSNPSTPSDQISENEDQKSPVPLDVNQVVQLKNEPGEVDDSDDQSAAANKNPANDSSDNNNNNCIVDPKRIKRILANRQSAQRSRVRKLHYISELERSVTTLQTEVSALSPRVAFLDHQRLLLNFDNSALRQRIAALAQDKIFKDAHQEALKKEIERLRQIYHEQNMKTMNSNASADAPPSAAAPMSCTEEA